MLVRPFEIEIGGPALVGPARTIEREGVRAAGIEPDVENVGDHLVFVGIVIRTEELRLALLAPRVDAFLAHRRDDARVHVRVLQIRAVRAHEQGDRHTPGALTGQHPVRAPLHHGTDAVPPPLGDELRVADGVQREAA